MVISNILKQKGCEEVDHTQGFYTDADFRSIALSWLKQQNLSGKSPSEVATMYYSAISEIRNKYQDQIQDDSVRRAMYRG